MEQHGCRSVSSVSSLVRCDPGCFAQLRVAVAFPSFVKILKGGGRAVRLDVTRYTWLHLYSIYTMFCSWPLWYRYPLTNWGRFVGKKFYRDDSRKLQCVFVCHLLHGMKWVGLEVQCDCCKCLQISKTYLEVCKLQDVECDFGKPMIPPISVFATCDDQWRHKDWRGLY